VPARPAHGAPVGRPHDDLADPARPPQPGHAVPAEAGQQGHAVDEREALDPFGRVLGEGQSPGAAPVVADEAALLPAQVVEEALHETAVERQ